jgi:glycosyltransferase involved in cell wall biosynthesis
VLPSLEAGGTERQLLYLLKGLQESHECSVICTRTGGAWADAARANGARVHELNTWGGRDLRIRGRARTVFQIERPHIVHTFLFGLDLATNRAARDAGVPIVVAGRRELAAWMKPRHVRAQQKANELVDCIVANSEAVADFAAHQEELCRDKIRVIYNGIDAQSFAAKSNPARMRATLRIPDGNRVIGMLANFSPVKDHALFVAAAAVLMQRRQNNHFVLAGSGPLRNEIERDIREKGMQDSFTIASPLDDVASFLGALDVCVLTSQREGFPNAVLEAMALGRPIVAATVGGIPELIEDGVSGLLVASREPSDFANTIARCLDDQPMAKALGIQAQRRVQSEFSVDRMVKGYRALYAELLSHAGLAS